MSIVDKLQDKTISGLVEIYVDKIPRSLLRSFQDCSQITMVKADNFDTLYNYFPQDGFFKGCSGMVSVSLGSLKGINECFFNGCSSLKEIDAPNLEAIEGSLYDVDFLRGCSSLERLYLPNLRRLGYSLSNVHGDLVSLKQVILPSIGSFRTTGSAKDVAPNIELIDLGPNVYNIHTLFDHLQNPDKLVCIIRATTPPSVYSLVSFKGVKTIYVPDEAVDTYKSTSPWDKAADKIFPLSQYV